MVKVDLVTGLPGSGKTTFISVYHKYLKEKNINAAVIENEFGALNVWKAVLSSLSCKGASPAGPHQTTRADFLAGGSLHAGRPCRKQPPGVDFSDLLLELAKKYDRIIVEPAGDFSYGDFLYVLEKPMVRAVCEPGQIFTVVRPRTLENMPYKILRRFIFLMQHTGFVMINRMDEATDEAVDMLKRETFSLMQKCFDSPLWQDKTEARIIDTTWSKLTAKDFDMMLSSTPIHFCRCGEPITDCGIITVRLRKAYTSEQLLSSLNALMQNDTMTVLRIKGHVPRNGGGSFFINFTENKKTVRPTRDVPRPELTLLGFGLDRAFIDNLTGPKR